MTERKCTCVSCPECRGVGSVWISLTGEYLGSSRCDDMDELERCEECEGSGIVDQCDLCAELAEERDDL